MKDRDFISNIYGTHRELGKQAKEIFDDGGNEGIQDKVTQNEESNKYSRELLESLTTGKSRTQLYQEAVDEQNKQKLLIKQISDTINNIELTFEQKQTIIDQLEQECGNMMYVIAFNTLVENHTISPLYYQQLLDIDKFIQERRDRDIDKFMQVITDLVNQSTTVNDPVARGDIIIKMTILMILGSGINIRKIHEVELMRLKQEFAGLFFSIPPGKKGSGTKKLLHTIKKSYTSVELSVNLHEKYPPLAQFVDMIDDLLKSSKDKDRQKKVGREKFIELHNSIFTFQHNMVADAIKDRQKKVGREKFIELHNSIFIFQHNKVADAIDNIGDPKKNEKLLRDRNKIANHPQRMEQYFMFLYLASCFPFLENFKKNNFKQNHIVYRLNNNAIRYMVDNLPVNIQGHGEVFGYIFKQGIVSHSLTNTSRNRSMDILYTFDIDSMDDEVLSFVLQQGVVLCRLLSNVLPFERLVRLLPKEHILKQIQSGSFPLKEFIDVYGFYNLQANPDGMWILDNMTDDKKYDLYEYLNKRYWSDYMSFSG